MAVDGLSITEQWIRDKLNLQHSCLADVRSLILPGTYEGKICHLGSSLKNFVRLKTLDLSHNALITVQGIEHLETLEKLNLYYNRLASLQDVFSLHKLQNLNELDLRLNPVVQRHPYYRLYLVHAMTKLRKLDDCPVRDRERKAALMHFSSESNLYPKQNRHVLTQDTACRSSEQRIKAVERMMKTLSHLEHNEEAALNEVCRMKHQSLTNRSEHEGSPRLLLENPSDVMHLINDSGCERSSTPNQESVLKNLDPKDGVPTRQGGHKVTFLSPIVESCRSVSCLNRGTVRGETMFTPHPTACAASQEDNCRTIKLQNSPNPILHPPRLTYQSRGTSDRSPPASERERKPRKGAYRKPMELLLSMMEELWSGTKENQQNRTLLMNMVKILSMMEKDVVDGEEEIQSLKETVKALNARTERQKKQHRSEIEEIQLQLQQAQESIEALNEQLKTVLEENVSLQKQLIRAEKRLLSSRLKNMTNIEDRELSDSSELNRKRQTVQDGHRANEIAHEQREHYKSLIARNERLLQQLEEALMS
ncbi:centrosomal protein of 72 kDa isoform X2 [Myxocyprinus asiaticus]|uniref:centrosomal protein of 72 kDa isoform X2 n=1 Tax=Myxocyprinus asiaticus TaxID=70543 RepID=UPI002221B003|nr:centrosomal protein of 72 kDa isoform X2 [Myxocyprinus asiaticus]